MFKALAVGREFACGITADGMDVLCWGDNHNGALGDGTYDRRPLAAPIAEPGPWKAIATGNFHACAIKENGELFCWGDASYGQVDGTQQQQTRPTPIRMTHPGGFAWNAVDGGARHTCAIDAASVMFCWGHNDQGQLGTGAGAGVKMISPIAGHADWESLTADELRTCAIKSGGSGFCWGYGALGQAGGGMAHQQASVEPAPIAGGHVWRSLSAGLDHTCGVTAGGELFCFGVEQLGELGIADGSSNEPIKAQNGTDFSVVFAGVLTTCATRTDPERLLCFGDNREGQLGVGHRSLLNQPFLVGGIGRVIAGGGGQWYTCALEDSGVAKCWGRDDDGRCGDGMADDHFLGPPVQGLTGTIERLTSVNHHTCALTTEGRVFCWGVNTKGQLGVGDLVDRAIAVEVPRPGGAAWTDISAGQNHTCGIAAEDLYCWGSDNDDQLGNGAAGATSEPQEIGAGTRWTSVAAGWRHTCAIDIDTHRWCWGNNDRNALGAGSTAMAREPSPVLITNGPGEWLQLTLGNNFGCGIRAGAGRELWCWGDNDARELGVGASPASAEEPLRVLSPSVDWRRIATDGNDGAVCGVRAPDASGGDLWCWGYNGASQLGTGNNSSPLAPTEVGSSRNWMVVDLGLDFGCGVSDALELRCWGHNDTKQVSDADVASVLSIPSGAIMPGTQFTDLVSGWTHSCARTTTNDVLCWGDGTNGQLGDGNQAHLVPTPVITAGN